MPEDGSWEQGVYDARLSDRDEDPPHWNWRVQCDVDQRQVSLSVIDREENVEGPGEFTGTYSGEDREVLWVGVMVYVENELVIDEWVEGWQHTTSIHGVEYDPDGDDQTPDVWFEGYHHATNGTESLDMEWGVMATDYRETP